MLSDCYRSGDTFRSIGRYRTAIGLLSDAIGLLSELSDGVIDCSWVCKTMPMASKACVLVGFLGNFSYYGTSLGKIVLSDAIGSIGVLSELSKVLSDRVR